MHIRSLRRIIAKFDKNGYYGYKHHVVKLFFNKNACFSPFPVKKYEISTKSREVFT